MHTAPQSLAVTARAHVDRASPATLALAVMEARCVGDISGREADTLEALAAALIASGAACVVVEIMTDSTPGGAL